MKNMKCLSWLLILCLVCSVLSSAISEQTGEDEVFSEVFEQTVENAEEVGEETGLAVEDANELKLTPDVSTTEMPEMDLPASEVEVACGGETPEARPYSDTSWMNDGQETGDDGIQEVSAASFNPYGDLISATYAACLLQNGGNSFSGWCGRYVCLQLDQLGIGYIVNSDASCNGNMIYYEMQENAKTGAGYTQKKYPGNNCLYDIINQYGNKVENIVLSWTHQYSGYGYSDGNPGYGHTNFIYGIIDDVVYFSESFNGYGYSEGDPQALSVSDFMSRYNTYYGNAIGAVLFTKSEPAEVSLYVENCSYEIVKECNQKDAPYADAGNIGKFSVGDVIHVVEILKNQYGNMWLKTSDGKYLYGGYKLKDGSWKKEGEQYVSFVSDDTVITWDNDTLNGTRLLVGEKHGIGGTVNSNATIVTIQGEFQNGDTRFGEATEEAPVNNTSYNMLGSSIDYSLLVGSLPISDQLKIVLTVKYKYNRGMKTGTKTISRNFSVTDKDPNSNPQPVPTLPPDPKPSPNKRCHVKKAGANGTITVNIGDVVQIVPDYAIKKKWAVKKISTSNKKAVKVNKWVMVIAVAEGTSKITLKTNQKNATLTVKVVDPKKPTSVKLSKKGTVKLSLKKTLKLKATVAPTTAVTNLKWKSSNSKVATVDSNGTVHPHKKGTVTISVITDNNKGAKVKVKVTD